MLGELSRLFGKLKPAELLRAFKRANQKVWTVKDDQVPPAPPPLWPNIRL